MLTALLVDLAATHAHQIVTTADARVSNVTIDNEPLEPSKKYTVAVPDYLLTGDPTVLRRIGYISGISGTLTAQERMDADTDLSEANLTWAVLRGANLTRANLTGANMEHAMLHETIFNNTILAKTKGLEGCVHTGPSSLDQRTLFRSGYLSEPFLRGCGLPSTLIDYLPSLLSDPVRFFTCFISYSQQDEAFPKGYMRI